MYVKLARASEHVRVVRVQIIRNFPQAKFDGEINAPYLLNVLADPHFLMREFKLHKVVYNKSYALL